MLVVNAVVVFSAGPGRPTAWPEQSQVVVETVTKTSTTQKFSAVQQVHESDATKVTATGAGLQHATANKEATFTVDTSHGGMYAWRTLREGMSHNRAFWLCVSCFTRLWLVTQTENQTV